MQIRFKLTGRAYAAHKDAFKDILRKHGLRWKGTFEDPWWGSATEKVTAYYERDEVLRRTISASLRWEGDHETRFLEEFRDWARGLDANESVVRPSESKTFMEDFLIFEMVYKPQAEYLETTGRPTSWIEKDMESWKEERSRKFGDDIPKP